MRRFLITLAGVAAAAAVPFTAQAEQMSSRDTVTVWQVDSSGRPPFKRERVEVPVVDTAALEQRSEAVETAVVWTVDRSGKPPYTRRREELPITDIAAAEAGSAPEATTFRGRPPFKRHR